MPSSLGKHLISVAWIFLLISAVRIQVSHAYSNINKMVECTSLVFELREIFLSFQMVFSLLRAVVVWAILESSSGLDHSSDIIAPRYLKLWTISSFLLSTLISVLMLLALLVINLMFSVLICILYDVEAVSRSLTRLAPSSFLASCLQNMGW